MPEVDVGITPGWGGTTRMARLIGRRRTKEINLLGALMSARRAVELDLWNVAVPAVDLDAAQGFEKLSAGLSGAVNGGWQIPDADQGAGVSGFATKGELWQTRRALAVDFWSR